MYRPIPGSRSAGGRKDEIEVDLVSVFAKRDIAFKPEGAKRVHPADNRVELCDGTFVDYDYLVIATGPDLAFDEVDSDRPNIARLIAGKEANAQGTWNAVCLADFGDSGVAFVGQPQIPPRNVNWSASGKWVHAAKIGFEKYFLRKIRMGKSEPYYERLALQMLGIDKLKNFGEGPLEDN